MATPPTLPISSQSNTSVGAASQPPIPSPTFRALISRMSSSLRQAFSQRRPWSEMVDRTSMSRPDTLAEAYSRIRKNSSYFRGNYVTLIAFALAVSLITHPFSLLVLFGLLAFWSYLHLFGLFASWLFLRFFRPSNQPLVLFGRTLADRETLGMLGMLTVFVTFLTSVGSLFISALMVGLALVHGAFSVPEDLFLDDQETNST